MLHEQILAEFEALREFMRDNDLSYNGSYTYIGNDTIRILLDFIPIDQTQEALHLLRINFPEYDIFLIDHPLTYGRRRHAIAVYLMGPGTRSIYWRLP